MEELAKRAVACKHWRWMDGMKPIDLTISYMDYPRIGSLYEESSHCMNSNLCKQFDLIPNLYDDATLGCLLALVREAWDDNGIYVLHHCGFWGCRDGEGNPFSRANLERSEAEALIAALEAAP